MVYGIVRFATLPSLAGTMLGGIRADQSWGRFRGWDPQGNGALIIAIWDAIHLHARWGRPAGARGLMMMSVFGNIVTAWSRFGTNLLEVGLHSHGFTDKGAVTPGIFVVTRMAIILLALIPARPRGTVPPSFRHDKRKPDNMMFSFNVDPLWTGRARRTRHGGFGETARPAKVCFPLGIGITRRFISSCTGMARRGCDHAKSVSLRMGNQR
jgi:hypothetical protein